jgi:diguanylate cyclase (GGDEF)-like protein/PAS domain S-box-containing protein
VPVFRQPTLPVILLPSTRLSVWALQAVLASLACLALGHWGLSIPLLHLVSPLPWLPGGLVLAALLRWGLGMAPGLWLAGCIVLLGSDLAPWQAAAASGAVVGAGLLSALLLRRLGFVGGIDGWRDAGLLLGVGVLLPTLAAVATAIVCLTVDGTLDRQAWLPAARTVARDALACALLALPLLAVSRNALHRAFAQWRWLASVALGAAAFAAAWAFARHGNAPAMLALASLPHLLLGGLAARRGLLPASATVLLTAFALASWAAKGVAGAGPLADAATLSAWLATLCATPLLASAVVGRTATQEARWQLALDAAGVGTLQWDLRSGRLGYSRRWLRMLGYGSLEFGHRIDELLARTHPSDSVRLLNALQPRGRSAPSAGEPDAFEFRLQTKDGRWLWLEGHARAVEWQPDGTPRRVIATAIDITDRHATEERQNVTTRLFEYLHEGLIITDAACRVLDVNPAFTKITGFSREEMLGAVPALLRPATDGEPGAAQRASMAAALESTGSWRGEIIDRRRDGELCALQVTISAIPGPDAELRHHVLVLSDTTQARLHREQLERQAHFDELTRLPNRARLAQMLRDAIRASERDGYLLVVCYLDLDNFKPVNDTHGHEAGDRLLVELAQRLRNALGRWDHWTDEVARLGGDEFVLLLRAATLEDAQATVERVLRQVSLPYNLGMGIGPVIVTASLGATVYPVDRADAETLLRHADHAMYGAKQAGRNGSLFFDTELNRRTEERFEALSRVQTALDAQEFCLYYQPKVDLRNGTVMGVEALLRWKHPQHGVIAPAHFLPLIEHTGLSASVGDWVLQQGIEQLAQWQRQGLDLTLSINVSARHLQEPLFAQRLAGLLSRYNSPVAQRLVIEVLETAALADVDYTVQLMQECRKLGVRFALDDFGTGYSTLTYLKRLPLDLLKIDRSFVQNMLLDPQDHAIVAGVISLSRTFGCTVVAEGVESRAQAQRLIAIGCDMAQGNGIAAAMPSSEVVAWVRQYRGAIAPERTVAA